MSEHDLAAAGVSDKALANPAYVRRAALMEGIDEFDADFFGFTPQSARMMDPQHRLFMQCAWHALEDAGYDPANLDGSVGVYGTSSASGYLLHNLMSHHDPHRIIGQGATFDMINLSMQNDKDYLATRVSHQFNLRGPALSVQTACSSSLVAVHLACQSLLSGESDMALAGAASIRVPHRVGYWHEAGSMVSASGHCRPFDVRADGTVFGSGVAIVVLKPLQAAIDDGDRIHAVIRGSAINNDGSTKMNYAAPNAAGQADVIAEAHAVAEVDASTIGYVETHGTGTPLGDPIEIEGLRQAFDLSDEPRSGPCVIGSVKSNIGHLEVASGIAGLIKAILCLEHKALPATLHYTSPNPELHLDRGPFVVRGEYGPWEWDGVRRAGVSSFGVGGTNAHIVLEEAPPVPPTDVAAGPQVLLLSARTAESLQQSRTALAAELSRPGRRVRLVRCRVHPSQPPQGGHPAWRPSSATSRMRRRFLAPPSTTMSSSASLPDGDTQSSTAVAFLFPGQGAQHIGMARGLYDSEPVFAKHFDECATGFGDEMGFDLRAEMFDGAGRDLERTDRAQPALFTVEYALAKLIQSYGVAPAALAGHSIGEYVAATLAGVFDLPTAIKAVSMRARLMHAAPRGVMVAVALSPDAIAEHLSPDVDLAAVNDPGSCVVAGTDEAIRTFQDRLAQQGIVARRVRTSHAFHSRLMDSGAAGVHRIPVPSDAPRTADPVAVQRHRHLDVGRRGDRPVDVGAPDPVHRAVRRRTRPYCSPIHPVSSSRWAPAARSTASAARHPRWSDRDTAPSGSCATMRRTEATATRSCWRSDSFGQRASTSTGLRSRQTANRIGCHFRAIRLSDSNIGSSTMRTVTWSWRHHRCDERSGGGQHCGRYRRSCRRKRHVADGDDAAAHLGAVPRPWLDRPQRQLLRARRRLADRDQRRDDRANEGLDLTPQDLYENQTVAALAKTLTARYAAGGLARLPRTTSCIRLCRPTSRTSSSTACGTSGRWRIPLVLQLRPTSATRRHSRGADRCDQHHDALRVRIMERAGTWEQHIGEAEEFTELATRSLPEGAAPGSPRSGTACLAILDEQIREPGSVRAAVDRDVYPRCRRAARRYLAMSLHGMAGDDASREILLTDLFTAFGQRLAGEDIVLQRVATPWREWSQRCAGARHPSRGPR